MKKFVLNFFLALPVILMLSSFSSGHDGREIVQLPVITKSYTEASQLTDYGYFDGLLYYKITSNSTNEVAVVKAESSAIDVTIPSQVIIDGKTYTCTRINDNAFKELKRMTSVTIPNSITIIGESAFWSCGGLTSITIPNSVTSIGDHAFSGCDGLTSITIPNSVTSIGKSTFNGCRGLTSVTIPNSVTSIGYCAFSNCDGLTSITIPNSVTSIGNGAFWCCSNIKEVVSLIENPFDIDCFEHNVFINSTLYVPVGAINKYKAKYGWKDFLFIKEGAGPSDGGENPTPPKCAKPTVSYQNGKLTFNCDTEVATCHSTITDTDITSYSSNEVQLGVTYNISVYATKAGYENSDVATATLCWIDVDPKTEGITNIVSNVRARAVLIQSNGNQLTISGAEEGSTINVFDMSGRPAGSAKASAETTTINTTLRSGDIGIVKIGDKAVKVLMK